jgi:hypothetical protein
MQVIAQRTFESSDLFLVSALFLTTQEQPETILIIGDSKKECKIIFRWSNSVNHNYFSITKKITDGEITFSIPDLKNIYKLFKNEVFNRLNEYWSKIDETTKK